jgi:hypothetical protein
MPDKVNIPNPQAGTYGVIDEVTFHARLVTTTSGTVDTTNTWLPAGQLLVKTATKTGRYTLTLPVARHKRLLQVIATPIGADDTAHAIAKGIQFFLRDNDVDGGAADGTIELQFTRTDTEADAELTDGASVLITVVLARGAVF